MRRVLLLLCLMARAVTAEIEFSGDGSPSGDVDQARTIAGAFGEFGPALTVRVVPDEGQPQLLTLPYRPLRDRRSGVLVRVAGEAAVTAWTASVSRSLAGRWRGRVLPDGSVLVRRAADIPVPAADAAAALAHRRDLQERLRDRDPVVVHLACKQVGAEARSDLLDELLALSDDHRAVSIPETTNGDCVVAAVEEDVATSAERALGELARWMPRPSVPPEPFTWKAWWGAPRPDPFAHSDGPAVILPRAVADAPEHWTIALSADWREVLYVELRRQGGDPLVFAARDLSTGLYRILWSHAIDDRAYGHDERLVADGHGCMVGYHRSGAAYAAWADEGELREHELPTPVLHRTRSIRAGGDVLSLGCDERTQWHLVRTRRSGATSIVLPSVAQPWPAYATESWAEVCALCADGEWAWAMFPVDGGIRVAALSGDRVVGTRELATRDERFWNAEMAIVPAGGRIAVAYWGDDNRLMVLERDLKPVGEARTLGKGARVAQLCADGDGWIIAYQRCTGLFVELVLRRLHADGSLGAETLVRRGPEMPRILGLRAEGGGARVATLEDGELWQWVYELAR